MTYIQATTGHTDPWTYAHSKEDTDYQQAINEENILTGFSGGSGVM